MVTSHHKTASGFSLVELMIAMAVSVSILGGAALLASSVQRTFQYQLNDVTVEQEARYALDWITRTIVTAGSNPYGVVSTNCPAAATAVAPIRLDPNANGVNDDIRIQTDAGIPNGLILGLGGAGTCIEPNEDVTITYPGAFDGVGRAITRFDPAVDATAVAQTEPIFTQLLFTYLAANRTVTAVPGAIRFVQVQITGQSRGRNPSTGQFTVFTLQSEVRLRAM